MSVHRWAYTPEKCDGDYCPGDCDYCQKADEFYMEFNDPTEATAERMNYAQSEGAYDE